jgi:hypothetical protein
MPTAKKCEDGDSWIQDMIMGNYCFIVTDKIVIRTVKARN